MLPVPQRNAGYLLVLVLVFGSIFLFIVSSFVGFVVTQNQVVNFRFEQQRATDIAEAGLNYYKWFLAHYPGDFTNGTGAPGPYVHQYIDPEDGAIGEFSLEIASSTYCGDVASVEITSTGYTYQDPSALAVVSARYTRPTVAEYSFITNSGVWYGSGGVVVGPLHSNQGVRMDAAHNSTIGSGQTDWTCDGSYGCSPDQTVPGVYASPVSNATPGLFQYPVSPIDFAGITLDLADMRDKAINNGGYFRGPTAQWGYLVTFNGDGTFDLREVTSTQYYWSYDSTQGWHDTERNVILSSNLVPGGNDIAIDPECPLIYLEDKVWLEGDIDQKVTIAAANLADSVNQTNIVINDDIEYVSGVDAGLLAIAEDDVDINLVIPGEDLELQGIFIAQNGRYGRNAYVTSGWVNRPPWTNVGLPSSLDPYVFLGDLNQLGTIVSRERAVVNWVGTSGFTGGGSSFDRDQVDDPPPLTPQTSDVYEFEDWRQEG